MTDGCRRCRDEVDGGGQREMTNLWLGENGALRCRLGCPGIAAAPGEEESALAYPLSFRKDISICR